MAKPKVLFTFVEAGMGHIMPMTGILDAFTKKYGDRCEIVKSYIFSESEHEEIRKIGKMQADHAKRVSVDVLYHKLEGLSYHLSSRLTLKCLDLVYGKKAITLAAEDLQRINPDLIVSTYYLPSHFARIANERGYTHTLIATYTPDPYVYPAWDRKCDLYLTNNSAAYELAARKGFEKSVLRQVPYIYKGGLFDVTIPRGGARKLLGLEDKYTVLITSGAYGTRGTEKLIKKLLESDLEIQLVVICGKNEQMKSRLKEWSKDKKKAEKLTIVGFTDKLSEYFRAADVAIGKSGINTTMEARCLGCPIILNASANALEEIAFDYFKKNQIAVCERSPKKIIGLIGRDVKEAGYLNSLLNDFTPYADPTGAEQTADLLFGLLQSHGLAE